MNKLHSSILMVLLCIVSSNLFAISYAPLPKDIDELISTSDLIVVGTIGGIVDKRMFYGYQKNSDFMAMKDSETPFQLGLPLVDFLISVEEVIVDDLLFPYAENNGKVIFRDFISDNQLSSSDGLVNRKGKMIFFLTRNPDNKTYGITSLMHMVMLETTDKKPSYSLGTERYKLPFTLGLNSDDFVEEVRLLFTNKDQ